MIDASKRLSAIMKKQPLDYFRNDPWWVRMLVLIIVRVICPTLIVAIAPLLIKALV